MPRLCIHEECKKSKKPGNARYGKRTTKNGGIREYCPKHKNAVPGLINLATSLCQHVLSNNPKTFCSKSANFNLDGIKPAIKCAEHKSDDMVNVNNKKCNTCKKNIPSFNLPGKKALYCAKCKTNEMVDVVHNKCKCKTNKKTPSFNYEGLVSAYCADCKKDGMISSNKKICKYTKKGIKCEKYAYYGVDGKNPEFCIEHREEDMINTSTTKCKHIDENGKKCSKQPKFNEVGNTNGIYCYEHCDKDTMINVCTYYCEHIDENGERCQIHASFNYEGESNAKFCKTHSLKKMVNVLSKKCAEPNCMIAPCFNFSGKIGGKYCSKHKKKTMINVVDKLCHCGKRAHYGDVDKNQAEFCASHKIKNMVLIGNKMCHNNCGRQYRNELYKGFCAQCYAEKFPNDPISKSYLVKEKAVRKFINETYPDKNFTFNKIIEGGSSKRRPDILFINTIKDKKCAIIVEIDENNHTRYDTEDEMVRLDEISNDLGNIPMFLIRFNPDSYINKSGKLVSSPWIRTKKGTVLGNEIKWNKRLNHLKKQFDVCLGVIPPISITIKFMYYDIDRNNTVLIE